MFGQTPVGQALVSISQNYFTQGKNRRVPRPPLEILFSGAFSIFIAKIYGKARVAYFTPFFENSYETRPISV